MSTTRPSPFLHFLPPYERLVPVNAPSQLPGTNPPFKGAALVWTLKEGWSVRQLETASVRPPGMALILILPPARTIPLDLDLLAVIEEGRPHTVLPFHPTPDVSEMRELLRRGPLDLPVEFVDYLTWRGLRLEPETRQLIRTMVSLSSELKTVSGLARSLYVSRRALGRRFMTRGLPVPSHWLQFCRILRAGILLQSTDQTLLEVAFNLGYPDGFALSNQMKRLIGVRPSTVRKYLGWEWLMEAWLLREASAGTLTLSPRNPNGRVTYCRPRDPNVERPTGAKLTKE